MKRTVICLIFCLLASTPAGADRDSGDRNRNLTNGSHYSFTVLDSEEDESEAIEEHLSITSYEGPQTCIVCHEEEAHSALNSVHLQWNGPTPDLSNTAEDAYRGKANLGINTFCTYAMSSQNVCFSCHVRSDGNAPHLPEVTDVDCLMCHSDIYQRKLILDPDTTITVTNFKGEEVTYLLGLTDEFGNYITEPDYSKMPEGITMEEVAQNVHRPTRSSCLRCHAAAGGGNWTKRGDLGWSSANPVLEEDVHLSPEGADLHCVNCHGNDSHKFGGRGIDLRQTEATPPTCKACHSDEPHESSDLNRHAQGQVSCQVCHIRSYGKGGETELSRDWLQPTWNPAFCYGQGGWVGHEVKESFVTPEYTWFDGTSYVYNTDETIEPGTDKIFHMAYANGEAFDGKSSIVPIKRHFSNMPVYRVDQTSYRVVPPAIMWMFMTGDFTVAIEKGLEDQGVSVPNGQVSIVDADAEMLITHGVDPSDQAPRCIECHDNSGQTADGWGMLSFSQLGYHELPDAVIACTLCHEKRNLSWKAMHREHREDLSCTSCHTADPTGLIAPRRTLCSSCHERERWEDDSHEEHIEDGISCASCHTFT